MALTAETWPIAASLLPFTPDAPPSADARFRHGGAVGPTSSSP